MNTALMHLWASLTLLTWNAVARRWAALSRLRPMCLQQQSMVYRWQTQTRRLLDAGESEVR